MVLATTARQPLDEYAVLGFWYIGRQSGTGIAFTGYSIRLLYPDHETEHMESLDRFDRNR